MKTWLVRAASIAVLVVIIGLVVTLAATGTAQADLGNQGFPVRCYNNSSATDYFMVCINPSGSPVFAGNQRVPIGYYFLVTDVMITPHGGASGNAVVFDLKDAYGDAYVQSINRFRVLDGATLGQHFEAPMWVLLPDHRLEVTELAGNQSDYDLRVNGFLVTNMSYLPLVSGSQ